MSGDKRHDQASIGKITSNRRAFIGSSAAAMLGLAGCTGDGNGSGGDGDSDGSDGSDSGGDSGSTPDAITGFTTRFPDEFNWNTAGTGEVPDHHIQNFVYSGFATMDADTEFRMVLGKSWDIPGTVNQGDEVTLTLKEGLTYHDGSDFTAEELADDIAIRIGTDDYPTRHFSEVEVVDDTTVALTAEQAVADSIVKEGLMGVTGQFGSEYVGDLPDRFREAESEDELEDLNAELAEQTWDEPIGVGPFQYESSSSDALVLSTFDDYAFDVDLPGMEIRYVGDTIQRATSTGTLDFSQDRSGWMLDNNNLPSDDQEPEVRNFRSSEGWTISFDQRHELFGRRNVRTAIAHVISRNSTVQDQLPTAVSEDQRQAVSETNVPPSLACLSNAQQEQFLGNMIDNWPTYSGNNQDRAQQLLEGEGFSREDGEWYTPNGDRWSPSIRAGPVFQPWARSVANQLQRFGIDCSMNGMEGGAYWDAQFSDQEFDMTVSLWGVGDHHVYGNYQPLDGTDGTVSQMGHVYGEEVDGETHYVVPLPPIGEPDGDPEPFDLTAAVAELGRAPENEATDLVRQLAWYNTYHVQQIPLVLTPIWNMVTHDDWTWPESDSPLSVGLDGYEGAVPWLLGEVGTQ